MKGYEYWFLIIFIAFFNWKISYFTYELKNISVGKYHYDIYIKTKRGEVMTQASNKENNYNVFVISAVFLLGAFITFLNSTFMNVALSDIMELKF